MLKKLGLVLLVFLLFIIGVILGGTYNIGSSNYFEEEKAKFEEEITTPNNDYVPAPLAPEGNGFSKAAQKVDQGIENIIGGFFRTIAKLMGDE